MIISASRRTDIPAFYSRWFMERVKAGFCTVPNPFNRRQVTTVSLRPEDVDVIVFWTRNPRPLFRHLDRLDNLGYRYIFQVTILGYPRYLDPHSPALEVAIRTFRHLADRVGPERMTWRYDPVLLNDEMGPAYHLARYREIASVLRGCTYRSVISLVDLYPKVARRLARLNTGAPLDSVDSLDDRRLEPLLTGIAQIAAANDMAVAGCAEVVDLARYGIAPGACIDAGYLNRLFGVTVGDRKDPGQRKFCRCAVSRDIGMYDSCLFGCRYCYATNSFARARDNFSRHDPNSPSLLAQEPVVI